MLSNPFDALIAKVRSVDLDRRRHWHVFRAFNIYRLALVCVLVGIFWLYEQQYIGKRFPDLFLTTSLAYLAFIVFALIGSWRRRPTFGIQTIVQALVDIVALTLISIASGGQESLLIPLLMIAVATAGILLSLSGALAMALLAWLCVAGYQLFRYGLPFAGAAVTETAEPWPETLGTLAAGALSALDPTVLGLAAICLFGAALLSFLLADRTRRHELSVGSELQHLLELAQLNQTIVQHVPSGLIVVDRFARIRLMNNAARQLLNHTAPADDLPLNEVSPLLSQRLATWLSITVNTPRPFRQAPHLPDITPTFSALHSHKRSGDTLILLEDSAQSAQRLQQIKMVALGRLTASIAHEVRNPLASISHAAQLLQESPTASNGDKRLGHIVHDNAKRANVIISNVLDLSSRDKAKPEEFVLEPWLDNFRQEFLRGRSAPVPVIDCQVRPADLVVRFDPNNLRQVLWHLLTNACTHGTPNGEQARISVVARLDPSLGFSRPVIDVIDQGPGVPELESDRIFEPFFTTKVQGTGLGLYVSREICEANRGQLQYLHDEHGGRFRIVLPAISRHEKQALRALRKVAL